MPLSVTDLCWCLHRGFTSAHIQCFIPPSGNMFPCRLWLLLGRAVASLLCTELHGNGGEGGEGPTAPRVLLTADPAHYSQLPHHFVSAYRRFAYTDTRAFIYRAIRTRDARSPVSLSLMISLQARNDHLCCRPIGAIHFNRSDVNVCECIS